MKLRVYYEDTDAGGIVYYANYLKFIERARSELFFKSGQNPMDETGHFVVRRVESDFFASARLGDELDIKTYLVDLKGASCTLEQEVYSGELLLYRAVVKLAHLSGDRPSRIPERRKEILEQLAVR